MGEYCGCQQVATIAELYREHDGVPDDPTWPDRLVAVLFLLREHILKEQDGVFPAALAALDADLWEGVEAVRARTRGLPIQQ